LRRRRDLHIELAALPLSRDGESLGHIGGLLELTEVCLSQDAERLHRYVRFCPEKLTHPRLGREAAASSVLISDGVAQLALWGSLSEEQRHLAAALEHFLYRELNARPDRAATAEGSVLSVVASCSVPQWAERIQVKKRTVTIAKIGRSTAADQAM
jgi:hypothetical protein